MSGGHVFTVIGIADRNCDNFEVFLGTVVKTRKTAPRSLPPPRVIDAAKFSSEFLAGETNSATATICFGAGDDNIVAFLSAMT